MNIETGNGHAWNLTDVSDQTGKVILITGAASGVGFESAKTLAARGATVILACRSLSRADEAMKKIFAVVPKAQLESLVLDLGSLKSVR